MSRPSDSVLELKNVSKVFGGKSAVDSVTFNVRSGEVFGFLGPNGAGKTTTIKMILDVLRPTSGTVELFGASSRLTRETHRRIGYLSGDMALDDDLTGRQYLGYVAKSHGGDYSDRIQQLAEELQADLDVKIGEYSRGNKQKIGLIASMMHQPDLLILDEPSSGFDPLMQEVFVRLTRDFNEAGGTVFISSHSLAEVQKLCDRVAFLRAGKLAGISDIDELNRTASKRVTISTDTEEIIRLAGAAAKVEGMNIIERLPKSLVVSYSGPINPLLHFCASFKLTDLIITEPELEDIFMSYYEDDSTESKTA